MSRFRCETHDVALVHNETTEEVRMVGTLSFQRDEYAFVATYVCPVAGCREYRTVTQ